MQLFGSTKYTLILHIAYNKYLKMVVMLAHRFIQDIMYLGSAKKLSQKTTKTDFLSNCLNEVLMSSNHKTCFSQRFPKG